MLGSLDDMRLTVISVALAAALPLAPAVACSSAPAPRQPADKVPTFTSHRIVKGLSHVWDVKSIGKEGWLFTERDSAKLRIVHRRQVHTVRFPSKDVWVSGETGLMSLAVDPDFATNRRFYTCQGGFLAHGHDVRVMAWKLSTDGKRAIAKGKLLGGFPTSSGRHGGCRLLIEKDSGALYVGTGDAAVGTNPRNLHSLGGKVLRLDRMTGAPWPDNPWIGSANRKQRYVFNYGHRNIQGLAQRADGTLWSVEHGPDRDDEINHVVAGGDFGWNPVPGYNESVPMTDQSLPGTQIDAAWSSGYPTLATSGATWVYGEQWGSLNGTLAVAALKAGRILFLRFDADGNFVSLRAPVALRQFGRLRSLTLAANGDLLATTDNGADDGIVRITPSTG